MRVWPGKPYPLGATWDGSGVNFALFSERATAIDLLLYDSRSSKEPRERIPLKERTVDVWHAYLPDILPGQLYAYSVQGPYEPAKGLRFNPHKALIDPYAKAIAGTIEWNDTLFAYRTGDGRDDLNASESDSGPYVPRCVVTDPSFDWEGDRLLNTPWHETIIYELHVRGFTMKHPEVEAGKRGTYAGLASPKVIRYLKDTGITAIELLPIHHHVDDKFLVDRGLSNYWGYNTIGFFAPDCRYSSAGLMGEQVAEFKQMVKEFHRAGIEVILDVVYNHTAEGNQLGPTLSFRGIDNLAYYRTSPNNPRYYVDFTGTGNSLNMRHPRVIQLIMDSLRYWVQEMHVDGFRFDLASALARELYDVDRLSTFFEVIQQDPVISKVKLIAEPWDLGAGGYQVGNFPALWAEWNGKFRDCSRRFWRGDEGHVAELAYRLTGSGDLYEDSGRRPHASINFVTCHDGFTLADLVSYNQKHNEANGEGNRDGWDNNLSWNCGTEGPTEDAGINMLRGTQARNFLATLFLSQGVPMLLAGDELGRSQRGNNNAFCQDNDVSWVDWEIDDSGRALLDFTRRVIHLRKEHRIFHRRRFFQGITSFGNLKDIVWLQSNGREMTEELWKQPKLRFIGMILVGNAMDEYSDRGERIADDTFLILFNSNHEPVGFSLPRLAENWEVILSTSATNGERVKELVKGGTVFEVEKRSLVILQWPRNTPAGDVGLAR